jgi:hypothetical protein
MKRWILMALALACGAPADDDELGQAEQGMSSKFSTTFTYGVSSNDRMKGTTANGCGSAFFCRMPRQTALKYKCFGTQGSFPNNWCDETETAFIHLKSDIDADGLSHPWSFSKVTGGQHVTVLEGTCSGNALTSTSIRTFVCTTWGAHTVLTESLPGNYAGWDSEMQILVDITKISARTASATDRHNILQHGLHAAALEATGSGLRPVTGSPSSDWDNDSVQRAGGSYQFSTFKSGDICRIRSFSSAVPASFSQASGSCPD